MRVALIEYGLRDTGRIRYISTNIYILKPDPKREHMYIASNSVDYGWIDKHTHIKKLTDTVYRDNSGYYFLTEEHPFFNAPILNRSAVKNKLDDNFLISHLLEGIRYHVKKSILEASAHYNK